MFRFGSLKHNTEKVFPLFNYSVVTHVL